MVRRILVHGLSLSYHFSFSSRSLADVREQHHDVDAGPSTSRQHMTAWVGLERLEQQTSPRPTVYITSWKGSGRQEHDEYMMKHSFSHF